MELSERKNKMRGTKKRISGLSDEVFQVCSKIARIYTDITNLYLEISVIKSRISDKVEVVECDVCGCLLNKQTAITGKSTIEITHGKEVIKEHYFCKMHARKGMK